MARGRPRKPTQAKVLEGTYRRDRDGDPAAIVADGQPRPPKPLKGDALKLWQDLVPGFVAGGLVGERDSAALAGMCEWYARYRRLGDQLDQIDLDDKDIHALTLRVAIAWDKFCQTAARFGLTPSDRAKLRVDVAAAKPKVASRKRDG